MSLASVSSTRAPNATTGIEPGPPDSAAEDAAPSGFDALLAGARPNQDAPASRANANRSDDDNSRHSDDTDGSDDTSTASADGTNPAGSAGGTTGAHDDSSAPAAKPKYESDPDGLLAALAALAARAGAGGLPDAAAPPPAADGGPVPSDPALTAGALPPAPAAIDLTTLGAPGVPAAADAKTGDTDPIAAPANLSTLDPTTLPAGPGPAPASTPSAKPPTPPAPVPAIAVPSVPTSPAAVANAAAAAHARSGPTATGSTTVAPVAPAPTSATTVVTNADDGTAATATIAPPPPAEQVVSVLSPLRTMANGSYTLRLELKPAELGRVEMRVEMKDGVLHASIQADHEGSAQLLRDALGELRDRLASEGVQTGELTVSDGGVGSKGGNGRDTTPTPGTAAATDDLNAPGVTPIPSATDPVSTSLLDVRV